MTAKEYLQRYLDADRAINAKLEQISRLRALATKTTQALQPDKVAGCTEDNMASIVAKIVDLSREVDEDIDRLQKIKREVEEVINSVPNAKQREVLRWRYLVGCTWEQIAVNMDITYQWVCKLHGRALKKISEKLIEVDTRSVV